MGKDLCRAIRRACDVQHVGSTAVPGLPAKPILDIAIAISTPRATPDLVEKLTNIGCVDRAAAGESGDHLFVMESAPDVRTAHIHIVDIAGPRWRNYLQFRDILCGDPAIRRRYVALKRELCDQHHGDRKTYTASKADFIQNILTGTS